MIPEGLDFIFLVGIILTAAFFGGRLFNRLRFPEVTGYIFAGIALKQLLPLFNVIPKERFTELVGDKLGQIPEITLALIAFVIGGSLPIAQLRRLGRGIAWIGMTEGFGAFICVTLLTLAVAPLVLYAAVEGVDPFNVVAAFALLMGAFSAATAPAATVAVIREFRARGDLTTTLLGVVGLDDAVALTIFTFASAAAASLMTVGQGVGGGLLMQVARPFLDILGSAVLGVAFGFGARYVVRLFRNKRESIVGGLGLILLSGGTAVALGLSPLFTNMLAGFILINSSSRSLRVFRSLEDVEAPVYAMFFTLAGTHLEFDSLGTVSLLAGVYLVARLVGKVTGVKVGAKLGRAPKVVSRYLGFGLMPQAGVAIGLVLIAKNNPVFAPFATTMTSIILGTVAINEIIGPPLTAYSLKKANEVTEKRAAKA